MQSNKPLISVIITTYNVEDFIDRTLDDILAQTYENIEVIVVDDGSSDQTVKKLKYFARKDSRVRLLLQAENSPGGVARAANIGIKSAKGEYLCFADGDDVFTNDFVERLFSVVDVTGTDLVICDYLELDNHTKRTEFSYDSGLWAHLLYDLELNGKSVRLNNDLRKNILRLCPAPWRKLYRTEFLSNSKILFDECPYFYEDNSFHWFNVLQCETVGFVSDRLVWHRLNRQGQTMGNKERLIDMLYQHHVIVNFLKQRNLWDNYKIISLEWLINTLGYLCGVVGERATRKLYAKARAEFKNYSLVEIRHFFKLHDQNLKNQLLVFAILTESMELFIQVSSNKFDLTHKERLQKIFLLNGIGGLLKKIKCRVLAQFFPQLNKNSELVELRAELVRLRRLYEISLLMTKEGS